MARPWRQTSSAMFGSRRGRVVGALLSLASLIAVTACGSAGSAAEWRQPGGSTTSPAESGVQLTYSHHKDATGVSPAQPVSVQVIDGTLDSVTLTEANGTLIKGELTNGNALWRTTEELAYDKSYTLTVKTTGENGKTVEDARTFTTLKPGNQTLPYIRAFRWSGPLLDGGTFGVGQPIVIQFDEPIPDRAAAERVLLVSAEPATVGAWRWISDQEVHWRPQAYWKPYTKVKVEANVFGVHLGNGLYGQQSFKAAFSIGQSKIAYVDSNTKRMKIFFDGVDVSKSVEAHFDASLPPGGDSNYDHGPGLKVSLGQPGAYDAKGNWVDFRTTSGPHVVMEKQDPVRMRPNLPKEDPLYYDEVIPKAVRISGEGEYVHWADWSVNDQGARNVSHGCVNLSPSDASWFFNTFSYGDVVEITNTGRQMGLTDGLGDWNLSWEEWQKGSALNAA